MKLRVYQQSTAVIIVAALMCEQTAKTLSLPVLEQSIETNGFTQADSDTVATTYIDANVKAWIDAESKADPTQTKAQTSVEQDTEGEDEPSDDSDDQSGDDSGDQTGDEAEN